MDETHGAAWFEFSVAGNVDVRCIRVVQRSMTNEGEARQSPRGSCWEPGARGSPGTDCEKLPALGPVEAKKKMPTATAKHVPSDRLST